MMRYTIETATKKSMHNDDILVEFASTYHMTLDIRYVNGLHIKLGKRKFTNYDDALAYIRDYKQVLGQILSK